jgi:alanyl-tRNA synthetase
LFIIELLLLIGWSIFIFPVLNYCFFCHNAILGLYHMILQEHRSVVKAIYSGSEYKTTASGDEGVGVVLESTSFYAEQGGQVDLSGQYIVDNSLDSCSCNPLIHHYLKNSFMVTDVENTNQNKSF